MVAPSRQTASEQVAFKQQVTRLKVTRLYGAGGSADDESRLLFFLRVFCGCCWKRIVLCDGQVSVAKVLT